MALVAAVCPAALALVGPCRLLFQPIEHAESAMEPSEKSQEEKKKGKEFESANAVSMISPIYKALSLKLEGLHRFF